MTSRPNERRSLVVVGEAPPPSADAGAPPTAFGPSTDSGRRLARLFGVRAEELHRRVRCVNLVEHPPGRRGRGAVGPGPRSRPPEERKLLRTDGVVAFLVAGKRAAEFMGLEPEYYLPQRFQGVPTFVFPHPSGTSQALNDPLERKRCERFLRAFLLLAAGVEAPAREDYLRRKKEKRC